MAVKGELKFSLPSYCAGCLGIIISVGFLTSEKSQPLILIASAFFLFVCFSDMLFGKIPNIINFSLILAGIGYNVIVTGTSGLFWSLIGALIGLSLLIIPYLSGGTGAGDVKVLAALGALLGPMGIFQTFLYTAVLGGILAILHYCFVHDIRKKTAAGFNALTTFIYTRDYSVFSSSSDSVSQKFPYASVIALGFFSFVKWGPIVTLIQSLAI